MFTGVGSVMKEVFRLRCNSQVIYRALAHLQRLVLVWQHQANMSSEDNILNNDFRLFSTYDDWIKILMAGLIVTTTIMLMPSVSLVIVGQSMQSVFSGTVNCMRTPGKM